MDSMNNDAQDDAVQTPSRLAELEEKEAAGTLTPEEEQELADLRANQTDEADEEEEGSEDSAMADDNGPVTTGDSTLDEADTADDEETV